MQYTYIYTGSTIAITPTVTSFLGTALTLGTDYDVTYSPATIQDQGDYTLTISPSAGSTYTGELTIGFTVTDNLQSTGSGYYVNLPKTGAKEASLVAHHVAKVYDDGGSAGRYSDNANGTLLLTAPAGYVIRLSGTIDVADENDVLTVYNGSTTSDASLGSFNADGSVSVVSTGTQMLVRFASDAYATASGLDLTATAIEVGGALALADNTDNSDLIALYDGISADVTLTRTLQAGGWNTFTVPFDLATPSGWTVKELKETDLSAGTLTLAFDNATSIEAGKPYLVKVDANVVNPTFSGVTVVSSTTPTTTTYADFVPVMSPTNLTGGDKSVLFVTGGNTLTYPTSSGNINAFRAYFKLKGAAAGVKAFNMSFEEDATSIRSIDNGQLIIDNEDEVWYSLDGVKQNGKPTAKGIYIHNGRKEAVK